MEDKTLKKRKKKHSHSLKDDDPFSDSFVKKEKKKKRRLHEIGGNPGMLGALIDVKDDISEASPSLSMKRQKDKRKLEESFSDEDFEKQLIEAAADDNMKDPIDETIICLDETKVEQGDTWSIEEDRCLLEEAKKVAPHSKESFRVSFKKLNMKAIASPIYEHSPQECLRRLKHLINLIPQTKTMQQILTDCLDDLVKIRMSKKETAFDRWRKDNKGKILRYMNEKSVSNDMAAETLWNQLSKESKVEYQRLRSSVVRGSPFETFFKNFKKKNPSLSPKESRNLARKEYSVLSEKKKRKYIKAFLDKSVSEGLLIDEENIINNLNISKSEGKILLKSLGMPTIPEKSLAIYVHKETTSDWSEQGGILLIVATKTFQKLSNQKQIEWKEKHKELWCDFKREYEQWLSSQPMYTPFIVRKCYEDLEKAINVKTTTDKEVKKKVSDDQKASKVFNTVEMPCSKIIFPGEPKLYLPIPFNSFKDKMTKKFPNVTHKEIAEKYKNLTKEQKAQLVEKCAKVKTETKEELLTFVRDMTDEQRRLFLGFRRYIFFRKFREDIFKDFPDDKYPVYIKPKDPQSAREAAKTETFLSPSKTSPNKREIYTDSDSESSESILSPSKKMFGLKKKPAYLSDSD